MLPCVAPAARQYRLHAVCALNGKYSSFKFLEAAKE